MSDITTIYNQFVTRISTQLPNHIRLKNAYQVEENNEQFLRQGWALAIGPSSNPNLLLSCQLSITRTFIVTISRKYFAREFDVLSKADTEKQLMEDAFLLISDIEKDATLNSGNNNTLFTGDTGIQSVFLEKDLFLYVQLSFETTYFEDLT